jgi:hypothetical protein
MDKQPSAFGMVDVQLADAPNTTGVPADRFESSSHRHTRANMHIPLCTALGTHHSIGNVEYGMSPIQQNIGMRGVFVRPSPTPPTTYKSNRRMQPGAKDQQPCSFMNQDLIFERPGNPSDSSIARRHHTLSPSPALT